MEETRNFLELKINNEGITEKYQGLVKNYNQKIEQEDVKLDKELLDMVKINEKINTNNNQDFIDSTYDSCAISHFAVEDILSRFVKLFNATDDTALSKETERVFLMLKKRISVYTDGFTEKFLKDVSAPKSKRGKKQWLYESLEGLEDIERKLGIQEAFTPEDFEIEE